VIAPARRDAAPPSDRDAADGDLRRDPRLFAFAFTAAVLWVHSRADLPDVWLCALLSLPALLPWRGRFAAGGVALGVLLATWHGEQWLQQRWPEARQNEEHVVRGRVASLPSQDGDAVHFLFAPETAREVARDGQAAAALPPLLRVGWYRSTVQPRGGECWVLRLRLRAPRGGANPAGFDYEGWLYRQDIAALATVRDGHPCASAASPGVLGLRAMLQARYRRWLPDHPARGLVEALTVGDSSELRDEDWLVFRKTGTTHLVVVSGLHVAIVAGIGFFLLRWLWVAVPALCLRWPAQRAAATGAALLAAAYALLSGLGAPSLRAVVMVVLATAAALLGRRASLSRMLALAWLAVLAPQPAVVLSPGLWLSFGAVAGIAFVASGRVGQLPAWRELLSVQMVLALLLAPLSLWFFGGISWVAPAVNLLAVPVMAVLMPALVLAPLLALVSPALGVPMLRLAADAVWQLRQALAWIAVQAPQSWVGGGTGAIAMLLAAAGALLLCAPRGLPTRLLGAALLAVLLLPQGSAPRHGVRVAVLDVGQGLAVALRTTHHAMVFDTGPAYPEGFDAGRAVVAPYLLGSGVHRLDLLMVSHADLDHRGGAPAVRELLRPRTEIGALAPTPCRDGQAWDWDGVHFAVLHPASAQWSRNNGGCVLRVSAGDHALLLPADIEAPAELRLLQAHPQLLRADVLVAPHHGSRTSSSPPFVTAVHPQWVIYAAGFANHYRLPRLAVEQRYRGAGARALMTGADGAVLFDLDPATGVTALRGWRRTPAQRFWNGPVLPLPRNR
jgi:competence protein ComEC